MATSIKTNPTPSPNKKNERNFYRVLFVQPDAPMEIIQASYRTIMQKLKAHPDLGGDHWVAAVINEAFETLSDPERRRAYDKELFKGNCWKSLGLQHESQRGRDFDLASTWQEFKPKQI